MSWSAAAAQAQAEVARRSVAHILQKALVLGFKSVFGDKVHAEVTLGAEAIREPEFAIWRVTDKAWRRAWARWWGLIFLGCKRFTTLY